MKTKTFLALLFSISFATGCVRVTGVKVSFGAKANAPEAGAKIERTPSATLFDASGHPLYTDPGW